MPTDSGHEGQPPKDSERSQREAPRLVSSQRQKEVSDIWDKQVPGWRGWHVEVQGGIKDLIRRGVLPQVAPEGTPDAETFRRSGHAGPGAMNNPDLFNPDNYVNAGLQSVARRIQAQIRTGAVEPEFFLRREREIERLIATGQLTGSELGAAEDMVADLERSEQALEQALISSREGPTRQNLLTREGRDEYFNKLFNTVDAIPHEFFDKAFNPMVQGIAYDNFIASLIQASRGGPGIPESEIPRIKEDLERYKTERRVREALHNMNAILYLPSVKANQLLENMQQFESLLGDYAQKTKGVAKMMSIYEDVLREEMLNNNGYLRPEAITGKTKVVTEASKDASGKPKKDSEGREIVDTYLVQVDNKNSVEEKTRQRFIEFIGKYGLTARDENGQSIRISDDLRNKPWEVDRTFIMARAMMIMNGRLLSIAAEGKLAEGLGQYSSLFLQDILQSYSPFIHLVGKYGITEANLSAYLFQPGQSVDTFMGLNAWNPDIIKKTLDRYWGNEKAILESPNEFFYLMQQNPNRAGDIFTWQSWRYVDDPETPSAIKDFVAKGRDRMHARWDKFHASAPKGEIYEEFIHRPEFDLARNGEKEIDPRTGKQEKHRGDLLKERMEKAWADEHKGAPSIKDYIEYANEYVNWIGTALRFEKMRSGLEKGERLEEGQAMLKKMVELQPHRLYLISDYIRKRVNDSLGLPDPEHQNASQKAKVDRILGNLSALETAMLRDRENILDEDIKFDDLTLEDIIKRGGVITNESEIAEVRDFIAKFNKDYKDNEAKYTEEFITRREYRHGFVLWSGDIPLDEFGMSALGPTGSFVRRARDNLAQVEAWGEELKLLNSIPDLKGPDDLLAALDQVYLKIQGYSADRAKEAYGQKLEGFLKFFGQSAITKIPIVGLVERAVGKTSAAQLFYGNEAASWSIRNMRYTIKRAHDKNRITDAKYNELIDRLKLGWADQFVDGGVTLLQLFLAYCLQYVATKTYTAKMA